MLTKLDTINLDTDLNSYSKSATLPKLVIDTSFAKVKKSNKEPKSATAVQRKNEWANSQINMDGPPFSNTMQFFPLYNKQNQQVSVSILPKLDRGFFLAGPEWTCYRRNYFQLSSSFALLDGNSMEAGLPCFIVVNGVPLKVETFLLGIDARVASGERKIGLTQHTPKRDKGPQMTPQPKPVNPGKPYPLNSENQTDSTISFERLQFKSATANNGKRRAAQQFFCIIVDLFCTTEDGQNFKVATIQSSPLVVRGRSPGHYTDNPAAISGQLADNGQLDSPISAYPPLTSAADGQYSGLPSPFANSPYSFQQDSSNALSPFNNFDMNSNSWIRNREDSNTSLNSMFSAESTKPSFFSNGMPPQSPSTNYPPPESSYFPNSGVNNYSGYQLSPHPLSSVQNMTLNDSNTSPISSPHPLSIGYGTGNELPTTSMPVFEIEQLKQNNTNDSNWGNGRNISNLNPSFVNDNQNYTPAQDTQYSYPNELSAQTDSQCYTEMSSQNDQQYGNLSSQENSYQLYGNINYSKQTDMGISNNTYVPGTANNVDQGQFVNEYSAQYLPNNESFSSY
ncbi:hypothetical protein BC833DRAFT_616964 [Globomyces pollinis-pini]|nr:hypothetical protein BC833DRAFT_616964 [Globomyces pollinis-pini]